MDLHSWLWYWSQWLLFHLDFRSLGLDTKRSAETQWSDPRAWYSEEYMSIQLLFCLGFLMRSKIWFFSASEWTMSYLMGYQTLEKYEKSYLSKSRPISPLSMPEKKQSNTPSKRGEYRIEWWGMIPQTSDNFRKKVLTFSRYFIYFSRPWDTYHIPR